MPSGIVKTGKGSRVNHHQSPLSEVWPALALALGLALAALGMPDPGLAQTNYFSFDSKEPQPAQVKSQEKPAAQKVQDNQPKPDYERWLNCVVFVRNPDGFIGSGFFVNQRGWLVTNFHVAQQHDQNKKPLDKVHQSLEILTRDGKTYNGILLKANQKIDLAMYDTQTESPNWLDISDISDDMSGMDVVAIGAPKSQKWSLSTGIISAVRKHEEYGQVVQTDAAINKGNSGGPLILKSNGKLVGANTFILRNKEGLNFAVSSAVIRDFINGKTAAGVTQ